MHVARKRTQWTGMMDAVRAMKIMRSDRVRRNSREMWNARIDLAKI